MPSPRLLASLPLLFLSACAHHRQIPLFDAAQTGDVETIEALLSHGAGPNQRDAGGLTVLIRSVRAGSVPVVETLLRHRADPDLRGGVNKWTPLMHAIHTNQLGAGRALLDGGAQVDARGRSGETG